ncbi:phospholipid-transporting ATPase IF-like isoform X1 [Amphibalanus amphitrite]|uniref:phospholipid-transporting ATPase IF-like isoform X1 n=1 Tax=Amphibalanus amphitrite TaxID=1232801 RepID=UPI001C909FFD|nr:phospholipid-transporting ATPase IF-like isoform X1 [Amphibalanus amphitrite]
MAPVFGHDNHAYSPDEEAVKLQSVQRLGSWPTEPQELQQLRNALAAGPAPGSAPGVVRGYLPGPTQQPMPTGPPHSAPPETTPPVTQETRFGATNGVSEAIPRPSRALPDMDLANGLNKVRDKAIGFVRQGSSKRFYRPVIIGTRKVKVGGHDLPGEVTDPEAKPKPAFPDNRISTSKYSIVTFLPKNLFEQFRRVANLYFFCIAMVQCLIDSPVSPVTSAMPLGFVVCVTMLKQGYEDWLRHKMDDEVNNKPATVIRNGRIQEVKTKRIAVGDIVCVRAEEDFPCDLVMLTSSDREGQCHIQTANLDGETNLKTKESPAQTRHMRSVSDLDAIRASIECENPRPDLYKFIGTMKFHNAASGTVESVPLGPEHVLLRGSRLKNTADIYGCAIYTGRDTKLALNLKITSNKFSSVEKSMNKFLVFFLLLLLCEVTFATLFSFFYQKTQEAVTSDNGLMEGSPWYLPEEEFAPINTIFSFLVIFNYIIPISLYVTVEMVKFAGTRFLEWDEELEYEGIRPKANTSDLNEELGQVEYLFSDKTGTLTENVMQFHHCSVAGLNYKEVNGELQLHDSRRRGQAALQRISPEMRMAELDGFLTALALCHTVQVTEATADDLLPRYQASSPDEKALVEACSRFGVVFGGITDDICKVTVKGEVKYYKRLHVLEFDSDRKRMSVIVEDAQGRVMLLCKGADSTVLAQCVEGDKERTVEHVNYYAMLGLRTLVFAWRELTKVQLDEFSLKLNQARSSMNRREEKVRVVVSEIESEMELLGATGVEDKLQEGVPATLEIMRAAGIKIWVLTGDKVETAVNIATSCGHFKRGTTMLRVVRFRSLPELRQTLAEHDLRTGQEIHGNFGLVLDGESLTLALHSRDTRHQLLDVATRCQAVVCCRMSPMQKAEMVKLVKYSKERPITAAIGDGANDVSMIQEAHVGFGLVGREGRQAARCSDFSFGRFRFLSRILLVHGHWYYVRLANLVQYSFYKNVAFITPQLFFAFSNYFSTTSLYDSLFLTFYNVFYTAALPLAYGILEQDIPAETLSKRPDIYQRFGKNVLLGWGEFVKWTLLGLWHASVPYFLVWYTWRADPIMVESGRMMGVYAFGTVICQIIVFVVNLKMIIMSRYMTWIFWLFFGGSLVCIFLTAVYSILRIPILDNSTMLGVYEMVASSPALWLLQLLLVTVCLLPDLLLEVARTHERGLGKFTDRVRVALGFHSSSASTLPAFTRRPLSSARRAASVRAPRGSVDRLPPPYEYYGTAGPPPPADGPVKVVDSSVRGAVENGASEPAPGVTSRTDRASRGTTAITDVST